MGGIGIFSSFSAILGESSALEASVAWSRSRGFGEKVGWSTHGMLWFPLARSLLNHFGCVDSLRAYILLR